jgi:NAD-dependent SIR2 family protein deacetylase
LKSSLTTTQQEIDDFSKRYEKNLDFVCIIGLSTQINPQAEPLIKHIRNSDIKPCIFVNDSSETTSIKRIIKKEDEEFKDIELEGDSA